MVTFSQPKNLSVYLVLFHRCLVCLYQVVKLVPFCRLEDNNNTVILAECEK